MNIVFTSLICSSIARYSNPFCIKAIKDPGGTKECDILDFATMDSYENEKAEWEKPKQSMGQLKTHKITSNQ